MRLTGKQTRALQEAANEHPHAICEEWLIIYGVTRNASGARQIADALVDAGLLERGRWHDNDGYDLTITQAGLAAIGARRRAEGALND